LRFSFGEVKKITNFVIQSTLKYGTGFEKDPAVDDCSFGMVGLVPLTLCYRRIRRLEEDAG
jgi:hypothetical protein